MQDFEKLGVFYLGRSYDIAARKPTDDLILYDSRDLVTHAVCVGMTGSGKTGLCLTILEEAAIDGIPVIAIDPKGDLANLLLTFPQLRPEDFGPWIDADESRRAGLTPEQLAAKEAETWKKGLADWGQDGARIQRLRDSADFSIYTPGSSAGLPVSVLKSFTAPDPAIREDGEAMRDQISSTVTGLLALLGIEADPVQSREHILLSTILGNAWKKGEDLDLPTLIHQIQSPPVDRIGVLDLESFFPAKDRFALAMSLNNLLASPGFDAWLQGEPLDIGAFMHTPQGKPRVTIFSIAHLSETERMFFVTLLLNQVIGWMRRQPGTTSLRGLIYMDEIFGYLPPVANPPSKLPMLTLLKQARAFGIGLVLATQNPVDLDYKALANAGTWFIGRLQTDRDKARLLDGLEGAATATSGPFDRKKMEQMLAALDKRIFLMHNVNETAAVVFQVRWALSYLRGPLTRAQIKTLMDHVRAKIGAGSSTPVKVDSKQVTTPVAGKGGGDRPLLPPEVAQYFAPCRDKPPDGSLLVYHPMILGCGQVYFLDAKKGIDVNNSIGKLAIPPDGAASLDWTAAAASTLGESDLEERPEEGAQFVSVPSAAARAKNYDAWKKSLAEALYRQETLELYRSPGLGEGSRPHESERDFRIRLQQSAREERDAQAEKLRLKYKPKLDAIEERIRRAQQAVEKEESQSKQSTLDTAISFGTTILGAFLGRKKVSATTIGKATTAARGAGRTMKKMEDVERARQNLTDLMDQRAELEDKFKAEVEELEAKINPMAEVLEVVVIKPKKKDVTVKLVALAWVPAWQAADGVSTGAKD